MTVQRVLSRRVTPVPLIEWPPVAGQWEQTQRVQMIPQKMWPHMTGLRVQWVRVEWPHVTGPQVQLVREEWPHVTVQREQ